MAAAPPPDIYDRVRRRLRRDRAAGRFAAHAFLLDHMIDELLERLSLVTRPFTDALVVGAYDGHLGAALAARGLAVSATEAGPAFAAATGALAIDEDRPAVVPASVDLVVSAGVLDQVSDLPGALALARRALRPDGLFLGAMIGAGSLPRLREAMLAADLGQGHAVARIHPQVDVRAAGDLLVRAGFALPVADGERLTIRYPGLPALVADLRGMGATSLLAGPVRPFGKAAYRAACDAFQARADPDGRVAETIELIYLLGWAPAPSQPKPAARGSATRSLADALKPRG